MSVFDVLGTSLNNQLPFTGVLEQWRQILLILPVRLIVSVHFMWSAVQLCLHRNVLQSETFNFYALSTFQTRLRLWEQKLNQSFEYLYFYLKHDSCHLGWMVMLAVTEASWLPIASVLTALPFESKALTAPLFLLLFFLAAHKCPGAGLARESTPTLTSSWLRSMNSVSLTY